MRYTGPGSGLGTGVFTGGYTAGAATGTATWASPQGPQTATQAGFGTTADPSGGRAGRLVHGVLSVGSACLVGLIALWSLPR